MKKNKTDLSDIGISKDQLKQILDLQSISSMLCYRGTITYKRLRPPAVKNATMGDIRHVIATQRHRETKEYWYHWEATYVFDGKNWVCIDKHECPEHKETAEQLEKIENAKREADMAIREAASCLHMKMLAM